MQASNVPLYMHWHPYAREIFEQCRHCLASQQSFAGDTPQQRCLVVPMGEAYHTSFQVPRSLVSLQGRTI